MVMAVVFVSELFTHTPSSPGYYTARKWNKTFLFSFSFLFLVEGFHRRDLIGLNSYKDNTLRARWPVFLSLFFMAVGLFYRAICVAYSCLSPLRSFSLYTQEKMGDGSSDPAAKKQLQLDALLLYYNRQPTTTTTKNGCSGDGLVDVVHHPSISILFLFQSSVSAVIFFFEPSVSLG